MFNASSKKQRVFIGLIEIAGYYGNLRHGLEQLGCKVRMVTITKHPFGYEEPPCGWTGELIKWYALRALGESPWPAWMPAWLRRLTGLVTVWLAALQHDVFVFSYGLSFADHPDGPGLAPLRALGRKVVFIFNGSDSRATHCDRTGYFIGGQYISAHRLLRLNQEKKARLARVHHAADLVIDYPLSGHFHPRRYTDFIRLGIPTVVPPPDKLPPPPGSGPPGSAIRILHCPSETGIKGSAEVRRVMTRLKSDGWNIEFIELRGVSNACVMEELQRCDIVVDQLFSDTPMAGFAREAAQFARPVIVGGYAWACLKEHLPAEEWPPSVLCHPDGLESCLREFLAKGPAHWAATGMLGYEFIRTRWTTRACAERFLLALNEPDKSTLWVDPRTCRYVWGCGMHALEIVELAQTIMRTRGSEGFCLDDKPELLALTAALGTIPLMDSPSSAIPELPPLTDETWSVVRSLMDRNAALSQQCVDLETRAAHLKQQQDEFAELRRIASEAGGAESGTVSAMWREVHDKLGNFRGMIQRRDQRIEKLEKKLGINKNKDTANTGGKDA